MGSWQRVVFKSTAQVFAASGQPLVLCQVVQLVQRVGDEINCACPRHKANTLSTNRKTTRGAAAGKRICICCAHLLDSCEEIEDRLLRALLLVCEEIKDRPLCTSCTKPVLIARLTAGATNAGYVMALYSLHGSQQVLSAHGMPLGCDRLPCCTCEAVVGSVGFCNTFNAFNAFNALGVVIGASNAYC